MVAFTKRMTAGFEELDPRCVIFAPRTQDSLFWNARLQLDPSKLVELRQSIQEKGLLQEPVVRKLADGRYQVVCGERRLRAILWLLTHKALCYDLAKGDIGIPADGLYGSMRLRVLYNCPDKEASTLSVAENLKRKDFTEWELMEYCRELSERKLPDGGEAYSRKDICDIIARSATWVSQTLSLYELPPEVQEMLSDGTLHRTVALGLLKVKSAHVALVLKRAAALATEEVKQAVEFSTKEVTQLEKTLEEAEMSIRMSEVVGTKTESLEARRLRTLTDRKLGEARQRQATARNRQPRLTQDALNKATDHVTGARRGKSTGMSHKAVRMAMKNANDRIAEGKLHCDLNNQDFDKRDVELVMLGLQMVLGEATHNVVDALRQRYIKEARAGWKEDGQPDVGPTPEGIGQAPAAEAAVA
jgi:ParB-like chromosome segregation protein Spo0J